MVLASDTNQVQLAIGLESTWGTQAVSGTTSEWNILRYSGSPKFGMSSRHISSKEINSNRNVTDSILVDKDVGGDVNFELSFMTLDSVIEGALFSDWTLAGRVKNAASDTPISSVADTEIITCGTHSFVVGSLVMLTGFTTSSNNTTAPTRVTAADETTITVIQAMATEAAAIPIGACIQEVGLEGVAGDITALVTDFSINSTTIDFTTFPIAAGDWILIDQFATAACNGWARVSSIAAKKIVLDRYPTGFTTDDGSGKTIRIYFGDKITNGITAKSYTIEQKFIDHTPDDFAIHTGCKINTLNFDITQADIVKGSWSVIGKSTSYSSSSASGASPVAAPTYGVYNSSSDVGSISYHTSGAETEWGTPNYILKASVALNNNLRKQTAVANIGAVGVGLGKCDVSGSIQTYFGDTTVLNLLTADTSLGLKFQFQDNANITSSGVGQHAFLIDLPKVKLSGGAPDVSGVDADVTVEMPFIACMHGTLAYTIKIQQFHYIP